MTTTGAPDGVRTGLRHVVVAMDGTSGSGKSSTSRGVASRLGLRYLDTGAQFRAVTAWMLDHGVEFTTAPRDEPYGRVAVFIDVSGNKWDLVGPPPRVVET